MGYLVPWRVSFPQLQHSTFSDAPGSPRWRGNGEKRSTGGGDVFKPCFAGSEIFPMNRSTMIDMWWSKLGGARWNSSKTFMVPTPGNPPPACLHDFSRRIRHQRFKGEEGEEPQKTPTEEVMSAFWPAFFAQIKQCSKYQRHDKNESSSKTSTKKGDYVKRGVPSSALKSANSTYVFPQNNFPEFLGSNISNSSKMCRWIFG